jgi:Domain of unknown function (DUF6398)
MGGGEEPVPGSQVTRLRAFSAKALLLHLDDPAFVLVLRGGLPGRHQVGDRRDTWGAAVVYALGQVNFLFNSSSGPHLTADELSAAFRGRQEHDEQH